MEIFAKRRYVTATGKHIEWTPFDIYERQQELDQIIATLDAAKPKVERRVIAAQVVADDKVLERAFNSKNGDVIRRLWAGDLSMHKGNHSSADLALVNHLWFFTGGNEAQVDRLFRRSGLMREKWDSARGATTYGDGVIKKAMS